MSDEIKEILDILKNCKDYDDEVFLIKQHSATLLLDYINNLQEENEKLLNENIVIKDVKYMVEETIYKSRCEKANELLKYYDPEPWSTYQITGETLLNLLNILQGENDATNKDL